MQQALDLPPRGEAAVRSWVGNGLENLVKRSLTNQMHAEPDAELLARAMPLMLDHYREHVCVHSQLYPGVRAGLDWLRGQGVQLAVVTNKGLAHTERLLDGLSIHAYFGAVIGGDSAPQKKPDPAPLLMALGQLGVSVEDALMVGDSKHDVLAARRAGLPVICVPYGYNHGEDIRDSQPDALIERIDELPALFSVAV
jgi:phosphoglycolate phosphatase